MRSNPLKNAARAMLASSALLAVVALANPERARQIILARQAEEYRLRGPIDVPPIDSAPFQYGGILMSEAGAGRSLIGNAADGLPGDVFVASATDSLWGPEGSGALVAMKEGARVPLGPIPDIPEAIPEPLGHPTPGVLPLVPEPAFDPHLPVEDPIPDPVASVTPVPQDMPSADADRIAKLLDLQLETEQYRLRAAKHAFESLAQPEPSSGPPAWPSVPASVIDQSRDEVGRITFERLDRRGRLFDAEFDDAPVRAVLARLGPELGWNFVAEPDVQGGVTLTLRRVSPHDALRAVLRAGGWKVEQEGELMIVRRAR